MTSVPYVPYVPVKPLSTTSQTADGDSTLGARPYLS